MKRSSLGKVTAILIVLCLLFGGVGFAPNIVSATGSSVAKAAGGVTRFVKPDTLKVRKKPSKSSAVVTTLKKDDRVKQLTFGNGWVKICYDKANDKCGYVRRTDIKKQISKAGFIALGEKRRKQIIKIAEGLGWKIKLRGSTTVDASSDLVAFDVIVINTDYEYKIMASGLIYFGWFAYDGYLVKADGSRTGVSIQENFDRIVSDLEKYAV